MVDVSGCEASWIFRPVRRARAAIRVFLFPCAGGSPISYRPWCEGFSDAVEVIAVRLPGRDSRFREPALYEMPTLIKALRQGLGPLLQPPFVFVGHSMGTLVAFDLARSLRRDALAGPQSLVVMGHRAPHIPLRRPPLCSLPDAELWSELRRLGGTPEQVLDSRELLELLTPTLRADLRVCELYDYRPEPPLDTPIVAYSGIHDHATSPLDVAAWKEHTRGRFVSRRFSGGHFFPLAQCAEVVEAVRHDALSVPAVTSSASDGDSWRFVTTGHD